MWKLYDQHCQSQKSKYQPNSKLEKDKIYTLRTEFFFLIHVFCDVGTLADLGQTDTEISQTFRNLIIKSVSHLNIQCLEGE